MRTRSLLHRLGAVVCGVLVLQLALLGPVAACAAPMTTQSGAHAMADMADAATPAARHDRTGGDDSCRLPLSASQCTTVVCTAVVLAPAPIATPRTPASASHARIVSEPPLLQSGGPTAPELPPPRA